MIEITSHISIKEDEIKFSFIRSPGPGGQNVNKVATAVLLRFNIKFALLLNETVRLRLLTALETRLTLQGELLIKASSYRTQERNKQDAIERLQAIIKQAATPPKPRRKTKPTYASKQRRLNQKKMTAKNKSFRQGGVNHE